MLPCGWLPLDVDTFAMDNGQTAKEGVGRTYAGVEKCLPAGVLSRALRPLSGVGAAPWRAALCMGHERGPYP